MFDISCKETKQKQFANVYFLGRIRKISQNLYVKRKKPTMVILHTLNIITNNKDKATLFNKYLTSQTQLNDENVPLPNLTVPNTIPLIQNIAVTPEEVKDILNTLK